MSDYNDGVLITDCENSFHQQISEHARWAEVRFELLFHGIYIIWTITLICASVLRDSTEKI